MSNKVSFLILLILGVGLAISQPAGAASQPELPDIAFIEGINARGQAYPLSCESRSAADLAGYWGLKVKEVEFFESLPVSDNPEEGFVGSVFGAWGQTPPKPYGVHAPPIAKLLRSYGLEATARKNMSLEELKTEIANGRPVIIWVVGHVWKGAPQEYRAKDGSVVTVAPYEHTMLAYGYDLAGVYLIDAGNGMRRGYSYKNFTASWAVLGNMAVTATGAGEVRVKAETFDREGPGIYVVQKGDYLTKLARNWGVGWRELAALNGIGWPYTIHPGQTLITGLKEPGEKDPPEAAQPAREPEPAPEADETPEGNRETGKIHKEGAALEGAALETYIVLKGEHLVQIAKKLQIRWTALAGLNGLTPPYQVVPGQVLLLPSPEADKTFSPRSEEGGDPSAGGSEYVAQEGDYLYMIAKNFGVNWHVLAEMNQIGAPYYVFPGQILQIPE